MLLYEQKHKDLELIANLLEDIDITAKIIDKEVDPNLDDPVLFLFLNSDEEGLWEGEDMPEDPHAATICHLNMYQGADDEGEDAEDSEETEFSKHLMFYFDVKVDCSDIDELAVLKLVNEFNSNIDIGKFYYAEEHSDLSAGVHFKYVLGNDIDAEFYDGVVGEVAILMGQYYDDMKAALLDLK